MGGMGKCVTNAASTTDWPHLVASSTYNDAMQWGQSVVEAAFVTHFPIPPIYPYLPFAPGYLTLHNTMSCTSRIGLSTFDGDMGM